MTKVEALELAREIKSGHARSYVQGAQSLADFLISEEAAYAQKMKDKLALAIARSKAREDERQLPLPLP